jgi:predicted N-acetyltransferase YhbS
MKEWVIRPYRSEDEAGVLNLLQNVFSKNFGPEWFEWRYRNNPFGDPILLVAESFSGEIVGFRASWRWPLALHGKVVSAYQSGDLCVRHDYRLQGIMLSLGKQGIEEARKREAWMVFAFPNANSLPGLLKFGYRVVDHLPAWGRILRPIPSFFNLLMTLKGKKDTKQTPVDLDTKLFRPARSYIDRIMELEEQRDSSRLRSLRSKEFYTWRLSRPKRLYYIFTLDGKTPLMLFHLQKQKVGDTALLLEQYVSTNSPEWKIAIEAMRRTKSINAVKSIKNQCLHEGNLGLRDRLYGRTNARPTLTVNVLQREAEIFLSKDMWDLNPLDMEFY